MASSAAPIVLGENLSLEPFPLQPPDTASPTVLIIGGGVTGLVTAWLLLDRGYRVHVVSKEWATFTEEQRLTSQIAGALWEYPPAVCGQHTDPISLSKSKGWSMTAYNIWKTIASDPALSALSGVCMKTSRFFFPFPVETDPSQYNKMREIQNSGVHNFVHSPSLIPEAGINPSYGALDAYAHDSPIIDTDVAMSWLMLLIRSKGAHLHTEIITGDLLPQEDTLLSQYGADVLINCTGLAARDLANDETCYPLRGALLRIVNDGQDFPKITSSLAITAGIDAAHDNEIVFIVPRNDDVLLIGGIAQPNQWNLDLKLDSPEIVRMRARAEKFLPALKHARLDAEYPLAQGLRPAREKNVRVEREGRVSADGKRSRIVHSYGQGGGGWSLSFGCANDVLGLVEEVLCGRTLLADESGTEEVVRTRGVDEGFVIRARL